MMEKDMHGPPREGQLMCKLFLSMHQPSESSLKELPAGICNSTAHPLVQRHKTRQLLPLSFLSRKITQQVLQAAASWLLMQIKCKSAAEKRALHLPGCSLDQRALTSRPQKLLPLLLLLDIDGRQRLPHKVLSCDGRIAPLLASNDSALVGLRAQHTSSESNTSTWKKSQPIN